MKVPLEWLKEYVTVRLAPQALAERLTMAGLEVVGITEVGGQPVLDIEVTPNRADCLSILGIAREVAAMTGQRLKLPLGEGRRVKGGGKPSKPLRPTPPTLRPTIVIEDKKGCTRYIGRLIEGVRVQLSPEWMQRRLLACGVRPINTVVDITNYVLLEYGQPLHAFDAARLAQCTIRVRRAQVGERLTTLDGQERRLAPEQLVIADAERPVAVAGLMGGQESAVTTQTTTVLLESALFDPGLVRRTARALGVTTESSYRFERGVDPAGVEAASARAASLLHELAGGVEAAVVDAGEKPAARAAIPLDPSRLSRCLGRRVEPAEIRTTLARLGCRVASGHADGGPRPWRGGGSAVLRVTPPSARLDLTQEVDLYEEVARLSGYDRLPATLPLLPLSGGLSEESAAYHRSQSVKCLCASLGLTEAISWSLVSEAALMRCGIDPAAATRLANPLSQDHVYVRPSLLPGLLEGLRWNLSRGASSVPLFEVGSVMPPGHADGGPRQRRGGLEERTHLGIVVCGWWERDWRKGEGSDFWVLKGLVQQLLGRLCRAEAVFRRDAQPWAQPGRSAVVQVDGRAVGAAGQVARTVLRAWDVEEDAWFAELTVDELLAVRRLAPAVAAPSAFPPVKRDLSLFVADEVDFETVDRTIREVAGKQAARVELIDRFTKGAAVPAGRYSLTFSIEYRDPTRTLTAAEADALHQRIGRTLVSRCGATLR